MLRGRFPFEQRATLAQNPTGKKLFEIMARKQSNLAVAADVPTVQQLFQLAEQVRLAWQAAIFDVLDICLAAWTLLASCMQMCMQLLSLERLAGGAAHLLPQNTRRHF